MSSHNSMLGREVTDEPRHPEAVASPRSSRYNWNQDYDEKDYSRRNLTAETRHHPSVSSAGGSSSRTADSLDLEKQAIGSPSKERESPRSSIRQSQDRRSKISRPERALYRVGGGSDSSPHHQTIRHIDDDDLPRQKTTSAAPRALQVLMYFLLLAPFLSFALAIWTMIIALVLTLLHPIRLIFTRERSFSEVVLSVLAPTLNLHLSCIKSFPTAGAEMQLAETLLVLLSSSVLSIGVAVWCVVLSVYWLFALIIGNPDGLDGRSDGRELVLTTRQKWDDWLRLSIKPQLRS